MNLYHVSHTVQLRNVILSSTEFKISARILANSPAQARLLFNIIFSYVGPNNQNEIHVEVVKMNISN